MLYTPVDDKKTNIESRNIDSTTLDRLEQLPSKLTSNNRVENFSYTHNRSALATMQQAYGNQAALRMLEVQKQRSLSMNPTQGGVLQRKCAGNLDNRAAGTCAESQAKQELSLQTKLRISEPGDRYEQEADRFAEQVMQIPEPMIQRLRGHTDPNAAESIYTANNFPAAWGGDQEPENGSSGTELTTNPQTNTAKPTLDYDKQKPQHLGCGDFQWNISWKLKNATENTNGFIIQKVHISWIIQGCDGKPDDVWENYWEAWEVKNGKVVPPEKGSDMFSASNTNGYKGSTLQRGEAKFMENYTEPYNWTRGGVKQFAGNMRATKQEPKGWSSQGTKYRVIAIQDFYCCDMRHDTSPIVIEEFDQ